jgi:pyruvate dehydrogenase E2 component (dihydrolipoamide acetyltransferase)
VLEKILVQPGQTVPIGAPIAVIGDGSGASSGGDGGAAAAPSDGGASAAPASGEPAEPATGEPTAPAVEPAPAPARAEASAAPEVPAAQEVPAPAADSATPAGAAGDGRLKASPVVRSLARTHGIDLATVTGTGPGARIIRADLEKLLGAPRPAAAAAAGTTAAPPATSPSGQAAAAGVAPVGAAGPDDERIPLSTIRKVTARRLSEAALVPAFQLTTVLDATRLTELRRDINSRLAGSGIKVSVTDLLVRAAAVALLAHPEINASFGGDAIIRHRRVNVGIAVALDDGLIVPVVKDADRKTVSEIGSKAKDLATRARAGKLTPDEFSGGTFTISNLGMYGIDSFIAVLNPPEAAILAVGSTVDEPVVIDGEVQIRARTRLTLTMDHRVADGATGAAFLRDLTDLLAEPLRLLV